MPYHLRSGCKRSGCCGASQSLAAPSRRRKRTNGRDNPATESDVSHSVDRLTALAKETLARVDRITAESSATLRQSGSSPPVTKNVVIVSKADQDAASISNAHRQTHNVGKPVSILKRKTSQEEGSASPPVTFSPSVLDHTSRRHGILKKSGGSLDESHLRRSCSPETEVSGSILKNRGQRRSSLEEGSNRQSILKRKETDDGHEPHGILKKKGPSDHHEESHISIADNVILAANGDLPLYYDDDDVRPILKKRSSSEDQTNVDLAFSSCDVTPRPILKKKSSTDTDEMDEWPKKTILKTSRKNSREEDEKISETFRRRSLGSTPLLRPTAARLSFCDDENQVVDFENSLRTRIRASRSFTSVRPTSPPSSQDDFSSIAWRRRSWENNSNFQKDLTRMEGPLSVAERISSMESAFHSNGALPKQPRSLSNRPNSHPSTSGDSPPLATFPGARSSFCQSPQLCGSPLRSPPPPLPLKSPPPSPPSSPPPPSHCSPSTPSRFSPPLPLGWDNWTLKSRISSPLPHNNGWFTNCSTSLTAENEQLEESGLGDSYGSDQKPSFAQATNIEEFGLVPNEESCKHLSSVEACEFKSNVVEGKMDDLKEKSEELRRSASRVSEKALLFSQMKEKLKPSVEEAQSKKSAEANTNTGVAHYRNRKAERAGESGRFSTQPITVHEIQDIKSGIVATKSASNLANAGLADELVTTGRIHNLIKMFGSISSSSKNSASFSKPLRSLRRNPHFTTQPISSLEVQQAIKNISQDSRSGQDELDDSEDENDPSKLSLAERVKLFNKAMTADRLPVMGAPAQLQGNRRRAPNARFKTQPVTIEEVSTAQSIIKQPTQQPIGLRSTEDFECSGTNLSKSISCSRMAGSVTKDSRVPSPKRGILKNTSPIIKQETTKSDQIRKENCNADEVSISSTSGSSESGLIHIKKVLGIEEEEHVGSDHIVQGALQSVERRQSLETANHSSSETDTESSSDSDDEKNSDPAHNTIRKNQESVQCKVQDEHKQYHSPAIIPKRTMRSDHDEKEVRKIISNDAVARRLQANLARQQLEKAKQQEKNDRPRPGRLDAGLTQRLSQQLQLRQPSQLARSRSNHAALRQDPDDAEGSDGEMAVQGGAMAGGLRRCLTQPMPVADLDDDVAVAANASIADRLKLLQKNGQTGWRKRVVRPAEEVAKSVSDSQQALKQLVAGSRSSVVAERPPELASLQRSGSGDRSSILADRLGKLENASQDWRKRVGEKDAEQFSVKGKMKMSSSVSDVPRVLGTPPLSPVTSISPPELATGSERGKKTPKPRSFRSKTGVPAHILKRSLSAPGAEEEPGVSPSQPEIRDTPEPSHNGTGNQFQGPRVEVPRNDDQFDQFFSSAEKLITSNDVSEMKDVDLDSAVTRSSELLVQKRTVKVAGRRVASRNPIKALSARTDLCNNYVEHRTGIAEKEMKRLCAEKLSKNSSLAVEALAGLASKEDFSSVSLRKSASTSAVPGGSTLLPYKELMLLQVKGRRHVQTRLVEPVARSINSGDNFVLVTPSQVYNWVGRYSNVIECNRGAEIALHIQQNKDLGFNGVAPVITINEERTTCTASQCATFWRLLGSLDGSKAQDAGHPDEDELFETAILETNIVYELQGSELVPSEKYWGCIPRIEMLDPSKILVFDFGSEMYIWNGKNAPLEHRKVALQLAKELWEQGYDYTDCDICPLLSATCLGPQFGRQEEAGNKSAKKRPLWTLIAKVTQHMETILFREKFLDWPDFTRVIQTKEDTSKEKIVDASVDVRPCDAKEMLHSEPEDPDLILEGSHLGRGSEYYDEETRRFYEIQTMGVKMWHIQEYEYSEMPENSYGQFHSGDNYVVRWAYRVTVTTRALNGQPSKHAASQGRDRFCYFCWQGRNALVNDKGAAALLTVELDKERGPQICVTQGVEPPAFLGLFDGRMSVHSGRREDRNNLKDSCRLYAVKGEIHREACLIEVTPSMRQLRSRGSFILLDSKRRVLHVWHGTRSLPDSRKIAESVAQRLLEKTPEEFGLPCNEEITIQSEEEGSESRDFFKGIGGSNRHLYVSLRRELEDGVSQKSPRLFHLTSLSGTFTATEVAGPCRSSQLTLPFPFHQNHLYGASQPAIFLLDSGDSLWLWQGWWPTERDEEDGNAVAGGEGLGSGAVRWQAERRAAMQSALDYWALSHPGKPPQASLVWAGLEPLEFTNLFLEWTDRDDIAEINIQDGHKAGEVLSVEAELARLTQSTYPAAQLLQRPLPDGVDPTRLELYLAPQHFQELLGMSKEEFMDLPHWKQSKLKKDAGLF